MGPVGYFLEYHNSLESSLGEQEKKLLVNTFIYILQVYYISFVYALCMHIHINLG